MADSSTRRTIAALLVVVAMTPAVIGTAGRGADVQGRSGVAEDSQ